MSYCLCIKDVYLLIMKLINKVILDPLYWAFVSLCLSGPGSLGLIISGFLLTSFNWVNNTGLY